jgi:hypothetical protein
LDAVLAPIARYFKSRAGLTTFMVMAYITFVSGVIIAKSQVVGPSANVSPNGIGGAANRRAYWIPRLSTSCAHAGELVARRVKSGGPESQAQHPANTEAMNMGVHTNASAPQSANPLSDPAIHAVVVAVVINVLIRLMQLAFASPLDPAIQGVLGLYTFATVASLVRDRWTGGP